MPATTSSPWALTRNSPKNSFAPVAGFRVNPTPVPEPIARVAEHHQLHVHGGADVVRDLVDAPVGDGALVVPGAEHGVTGHLQLLHRVLRERLARLLGDELLVARHGLPHAVLAEVGVDLGAVRVLDRLELVLELLLRDLQHDVAEHLHEAAVAVVGEPAVLRAGLQPLDRGVVQPQVEDGVHHARHRELRARAHRDEQRVVGRPERRARRLLQPAHVGHHLVLDRLRELAALGVPEVAGRRRDREPGRHGQPGVGHLRQARALAAEDVLHRAVALRLAVRRRRTRTSSRPSSPPSPRPRRLLRGLLRTASPPSPRASPRACPRPLRLLRASCFLVFAVFLAICAVTPSMSVTPPWGLSPRYPPARAAARAAA